jgi:hypothetical protein
MGLSANRREIGKKRPEKQVESRIIARRRSHPGSSQCDYKSQVAKNKGNGEHRPGPVRVCKTFCRPT